MSRFSETERNTKETKIKVALELDGNGNANIDTGVGFFNHMLEGFTKHGFFDLNLKCVGDLQVDAHHTVEDCGITLGMALEKALGDKKGISRFGNFILPMDDALVLCAIDLGGRPYLNFDVDFPTEKCGDMDTQLANEFFYAISYSAKMNIHFKKLSGTNSHHIMEACFKAFAKALDQATRMDERLNGNVLSTKGTL